ncbi:restriction endonuclease, partial [Yersinia enterocolitica]
NGKINKENRVSITSYLRKTYFYQYQEYIVNTPFSSWLLYRDSHFDNVSSTLIFGKFKVFRDRQLTQKNTITSGKYRVIKSRNIANGKIINIEGYDRYVNELTGLSVAKFLNTSVILVPNLTYNPRAARLPENCIADGSAAILYGDYEVSDDDILYFSSEEFNDFYRVARNYGTRSMNIDSVSVCYFGIKK